MTPAWSENPAALARKGLVASVLGWARRAASSHPPACLDRACMELGGLALVQRGDGAVGRTLWTAPASITRRTTAATLAGCTTPAWRKRRCLGLPGNWRLLLIPRTTLLWFLPALLCLSTYQTAQLQETLRPQTPSKM